MSDRANVNPMDVVSVGDIVDVWIYELDSERGRIALSLLPPDKLKERDQRRKQQFRPAPKKPDPAAEKQKMNDSLAALKAKFKGL
jgi:uncharacterized protein